MFDKLQQKFVVFTTIIGTMVLLLITITINLVNYIGVSDYTDKLLDSLIQNNMLLNESFDAENNFSREIEYTTRFFRVVIKDGEITLADTGNISAISAEEASLLAEQVAESGNESGIIDVYKYVKQVSEEGDVYIFLDVEKEISGIYNYAVYSAFAVLIFIILIVLLSYVCSRRVVAVIVEGYERQKCFITDVSHEFKTPLAIIKADNDVIEIEHGEDEWTNSIKAQVLRLNNLVENLVSLAKLEEKNSSSLNTEFTLSNTLTQTIQEFSPQMRQKNMEIMAEIEKNIMCLGDEQLIQKLFEILIENAIKYTIDESELKIKLYSKGNKKIFTIENACAELEVGRYNQWFERFYREDKSRNSQAKGFGIGLSIAKSICDRHGAKINAKSVTGKEVVMTIIF